MTLIICSIIVIAILYAIINKNNSNNNLIKKSHLKDKEINTTPSHTHTIDDYFLPVESSNPIFINPKGHYAKHKRDKRKRKNIKLFKKISRK